LLPVDERRVELLGLVLDIEALLLDVIWVEALELVGLLPLVDATRIDVSFEVEVRLLVRDVDSDWELKSDDDDDSVLSNMSTRLWHITSRLWDQKKWVIGGLRKESGRKVVRFDDGRFERDKITYLGSQ
jgi:hypothetical protein